MGKSLLYVLEKRLMQNRFGNRSLRLNALHRLTDHNTS